MHEITFVNRLCFPFRVYRPSRLNRQTRTMQPVLYALGMSGTIVLYAPLILML